MEGRSGTIDEKNLLANYQAALLAQANGQQQANLAAAMMQQQQLAMLNQAQAVQYLTAAQNMPLQQNDTFNVIQNSLASGVPTLHLATIFSYLGYSNTFPGQNSANCKTSNGNSKREKLSNFELKYAKLMDVIQEIGRDVRPVYTGSKTASDRLRRQINQARHLVRECLMEVDRRAAQRNNNN